MITVIRVLIGLRLAIATGGEIVLVGISTLSLRSAAYILGFSLGSISPLFLVNYSEDLDIKPSIYVKNSFYIYYLVHLLVLFFVRSLWS